MGKSGREGRNWKEMWNKRKGFVLSVAGFSDERFIQRFNEDRKDLIEKERLRYKRLKE